MGDWATQPLGAMNPTGAASAGSGAASDLPGRDPLVVEICNADGGSWALCPWLGSGIRIVTPACGVPTAELDVTIGGAGWGVAVDPDHKPNAYTRLENLVDDGTRLRVRTVRAHVSQQLVLFEGLVEGIEYSATSKGRTAKLSCIHLADVLRTETLVAGQILANLKELAPSSDQPPQDPPTPAGNIRPMLVTALDCVFNPAGAGNRAFALAKINGIDGAGDAKLPIFTHTRWQQAGGQRVAWNYGAALYYLLRYAQIQPGAPGTDGGPKQQPFSRYSFIELEAEDGLTLTGRMEKQREDGKTWLDLDADKDSAPDDAWGRALLAKPISLSIEGLNWQEALDWICAKCGVGYAWESRATVSGGDGTGTGDTGTDGAASGGATRLTAASDAGAQAGAAGASGTLKVQWGLRFFTLEGARQTSLKLPSTGFTTHDRRWSANAAAGAGESSDAVEDHANVELLNVQASYHDMATRARLLGAPKKHEVTIELLPGWVADATWDVDPSDANAVNNALAIVPLDDFEQNYGTVGLRFPLYAMTGRLWGVNTWGDWTKLGRIWRDHAFHKDFAQDGAKPALANRYVLLDLGTLRIPPYEGPTGAPAGKPLGWNVPRPRTWMECLSGCVLGQPFAPQVEYSVNEGAAGTWLPLPGVDIGQRDLRIWLNTPDLRAIGGWNTTLNMYLDLPSAYIRSKLRVRITACIEADDRFRNDYWLVNGSGPTTRSQRLRLAVLQGPDTWKIERRDDDGIWGHAGNSQWNGTTANRAALHQRDDSKVMDAEAKRYVARRDRVQWRGTATMPGVVAAQVLTDGTVVSGYRVGDRIASIAADDNDFATLHLRCNKVAAYDGATVVALLHEYRVDADSVVQQTTLQLEDKGRLVRSGA